MALYATTGSHLFIGSARGEQPEWAVMESAFADEIWTEVRPLIGLGRIAGEWQTNESSVPGPMDDLTIPGHVAIDKAYAPARQMQVVVATDPEDTGQERMLIAEVSTEAFAIRVDLSDGSRRQFLALVTGLEDAFDEANSLMTMVFTLTLQSTVVRSVA
jgi:hypothetical protein